MVFLNETILILTGKLKIKETIKRKYEKVKQLTKFFFIILILRF